MFEICSVRRARVQSRALNDLPSPRPLLQARWQRACWPRAQRRARRRWARWSLPCSCPCSKVWPSPACLREARPPALLHQMRATGRTERCRAGIERSIPPEPVPNCTPSFQHFTNLTQPSRTVYSTLAHQSPLARPTNAPFAQLVGATAWLSAPSSSCVARSPPILERNVNLRQSVMSGAWFRMEAKLLVVSATATIADASRRRHAALRRPRWRAAGF